MSPHSLPAPIVGYLQWGRSRLAKLGLPDPTPADAAAGVPGAPLCVARNVAGEGCGLRVSRDLPAGAHELFRVPGSMQFRASHSAIASLLPAATSGNGWLRMQLSLLSEWSLGAKSAWSGFIGAMPTRCDQPQFWTDDQANQLQGCTFAPRALYFDLEHDYQTKVLPWIAVNGKAAGLHPGSSCTLARFELVTGWIISRAFRPTCSSSSSSDAEPEPVLLPLVDLMNTTSLNIERDEEAMSAAAPYGESGPFHRRINCSVHWVAGGPSGTDLDDPVLLIRTLPSAGPLHAGQQLFLPYGSRPLSSAELLCRYGFLEGRWPLSENPHDVVSVTPRDLVSHLQGGAATGAPGAQAMTNRAEASEDVEAKALHEQHMKEKRERRKEKQREQDAAAAASAAAAVTPIKSAGSGQRRKSSLVASPRKCVAGIDSDEADDDDDDDAASEASGSSESLDTLLSLADSLPDLNVEAFHIPASGVPPTRMVQFVGVVLGLIDGQQFKEWVEGDARRARAEAERAVRQGRREALQGAGSGDEAAEGEDAEATTDPIPSPCPSPSSATGLGGFHMSGAAASASSSPPPASDAAAAAAAAAASAPLPASSSACVPTSTPTPSDESAAALVSSSPDVLEGVFFLCHALLSQYATTLEEDTSLLAFFEGQEKEREREWADMQATTATKKGKKGGATAAAAAAAGAATSPAPPASPSPTSLPDASADSVRLLLALRVRMSEKRILYRTLEHVQRRLVELAGSDDPMGSGGADTAGAGADAEHAAADTLTSDTDDDVDLSLDHPDPNLTSPSLFRMLSQQKRPPPGSDEDALADDTYDEQQEETQEQRESEEAEESHARPIRFTYNKSSSRGAQASKKRRG